MPLEKLDYHYKLLLEKKKEESDAAEKANKKTK
jgi:hypothetical protein